MFKWICVIFLVYLVSPRQALEENPRTMEPDLSTKLFSEIDKYLSELILNHETMLKYESLCSSNGESFDETYEDDRDLIFAPMVKAKFKLLERHVHSRNLAKECPNMENNVKEYRNSLRLRHKASNITNL